MLAGLRSGRTLCICKGENTLRFFSKSAERCDTRPFEIGNEGELKEFKRINIGFGIVSVGGGGGGKNILGGRAMGALGIGAKEAIGVDA